MTLEYKLEFYDYWHLSSGLSAGARLDSSVVKDENNLPFAPGKTIKGLAREMAEYSEDKTLVRECFGEEVIKMGVCYFTNVTLKDSTRNEVVSHALQDNLYDVVASTKIDDNGVAEDKSLREIEVVVPLCLYGKILDVPSNYVEEMKKSLQMIKRAGLNRNRGLGRCEFTVEVVS